MFPRNFLKMSFRLIKHLFVAGIYFTCSCMSQHIENNSLIYAWDENHRMNLYCQFASAKELERIHFLTKCFTNNKEMQHILADGTKTFPYAPDGSVGFKLKCGNIPNGKLMPSCSRYVYTNCSYSCGTSDVVHRATCNLVGPWNNVTAQWSLTEPCVVPNSVPYTSTRFPKSSSTAEPEVEVTARSTDVSFQNNSSSDGGSPSVAFSAGNTADDMTRVIIACVVTAVICVLLLFSFAAYFCRCRRKSTQQLSGPAHQEQCNGHSQNHNVELEQEPPAVDSSIHQPLCVPLLGHTEGQGGPAHQEQCNGHSQNHDVELKQEPPVVDISIHQPSCVPLLEPTERLGFGELQDRGGLSDYNYADNNKYKGIDDKDLREVFNEWSTIDCASLDKIFVANVSGTVSYSKSPNGFVKDMPGAAVNVSNTQNGLVADLDMCNATVGLLQEQKNSYRKWLRAELEVIPGRSREQALIGYMEENERALGYMHNEIKLRERSFETRVDSKVSDEFLHKLAAYGVKLGSIVRYFYLHGNSEAITAILHVHRDCQFCEKFKRL